MEDFAYAKFMICNYVSVRNALSKKAVSSESNAGLERFFFDDLSSVTIPPKEKPRAIMTVRYTGRHYPRYVGSLEKYLRKVNLIMI